MVNADVKNLYHKYNTSLGEFENENIWYHSALKNVS
jgi:hypothetical protein